MVCYWPDGCVAPESCRQTGVCQADSPADMALYELLENGCCPGCGLLLDDEDKSDEALEQFVLLEYDDGDCVYICLACKAYGDEVQRSLEVGD